MLLLLQKPNQRHWLKPMKIDGMYDARHRDVHLVLQLPVFGSSYLQAIIQP